MQVIDREKAPEYQQVDKVEIQQPQRFDLNNGVPVHVLGAGSQEVVRIEFIFDAGSWFQKQPLLATATCSMLNEGTRSYSALELAERIDYYGAFLELKTDQDVAILGLYTLNKHLEQVLPLFAEIVCSPTFPQEEFETYIANAQHRFLVNQKQVGILARTEFMERIFGQNHPYGRKITAGHFDQLERAQIVEFFNSRYTNSERRIVVAGNVPESLLPLLEGHFGANVGSDAQRKSTYITPDAQTEFNPEATVVAKDDAVQSAIRIGRPLFNKTHKDFHSLQVLNTVLGGYFGSRLMSNIREDKGYTYGIGSGLASQHNGGYFFISTEVGADVTQPALDEIYAELGRLGRELIPTDELQRVKNYMLGSFLRSIDGPFALADRAKGILPYGLGYDHYTTFVETVRSVTAERLMALANQYLDPAGMVEVVAGRK